MKKLKVYISGPISKGDRGQNLARFISWHESLMTSGFAVFNPGLSMLLPWAADKSHSQWMEAEIPFVLQCDLVVRLPGESDGADQEVEAAFKAGIPVYFAPEKPEDKPRSLSLERFAKEVKALVGDGYVLADPSKPIANGVSYRLLQGFAGDLYVSRAHAYGSGIRYGLAIAVKQPEAKPASPRPEVAAGAITVEAKKPETKFKEGDKVQVNGPSTHNFYTGPFPATGKVERCYPRQTGSRYDVILDKPDHNGDTCFTFHEANLTQLVEDPAKPAPGFKPGDFVYITGPSTMRYYSGPFPADGTVKRVHSRECDVVLGFCADYRNTEGFTFRKENLKLVKEPAKKGQKFKKGDSVTIVASSAACSYSGPFPAVGSVFDVIADDKPEPGYGVYIHKQNGKRNSAYFMESALAPPSYPQTVQAYSVSWHLATAADIGKPCYMMFPLNNAPGSLPKIEPSELGHIVQEVYVDGRVVSDCGSKAPAAYVPDKIPAKKEGIKPGDFVYITGKSIAGHDQRKGTVQKVSSVDYDRCVWLDILSLNRNASGAIFPEDSVLKIAIPPGWRPLAENEQIQNGDMVHWPMVPEKMKDPGHILKVAIKYRGTHMSTPLAEKAVVLRKIEQLAAEPVRCDVL